MKGKFRGNRDFWAGIMFAAVGVVAIIMARDYPYGSMLRMGAGYFPTFLGVILILFGITIMVQGLRKGEAIEGSWSLRALFVLPAITVLFGVLLERTGFVPALAVLAFGSATAGSDFRWGEALLFTLFLTALSFAVFIWGLGLPYPLFKGF
jgi:hypothetical protein